MRLVRRRAETYPGILGDEIAAVTKVLRTPDWNMNYGVNLVHRTLETELARYVGVKHAVAVNTGGMAIQMALRALGLKPGDEVLHQVDTCVADAFAVLNAGATPLFVDVDEATFMASPQSMEAMISPRTKVLMPIHMWGNPQNMDRINELGRRHSLFVLEDACLSIGAEWSGRRVGSLGHAGVFSFGCLKPLQAGEGGMLVTDDDALAKELRTLREWGDRTKEHGERDHSTLAWNGRMPEIVAAVALEQLKAYPEHLARVTESVEQVAKFLDKIDGLSLVRPGGTARSAYSQLVLRIDAVALGMSKAELMRRLAANGISCWHACFEPIPSLSFFRSDHWRDWILRGDLERIEKNYHCAYPGSERVYRELGIGIAKRHLLSAATTRDLLRRLDGILVRQEQAA